MAEGKKHVTPLELRLSALTRLYTGRFMLFIPLLSVGYIVF